MWSILIIIGIIPVAAYWAGRYFIYQKTTLALGRQDCRISTEELAQRMGFTQKIPRSLRGKRHASALAEVVMLAGLAVLQRDHAKPVAMRLRADLFALAIAPLSLIVAVFAIFVGKQILLTVLAVVIVNAIAALMKFTSMTIAKHAAAVGTKLLHEARIPRESDEQIIENCVKVLAWR
jgi:hypothetical protein